MSKPPTFMEESAERIRQSPEYLDEWLQIEKTTFVDLALREYTDDQLETIDGLQERVRNLALYLNERVPHGVDHRDTLATLLRFFRYCMLSVFANGTRPHV